LLPLMAVVHVANSHEVQLIASSPKKTDRHDTRILAKLSVAVLLPEVWIPLSMCANCAV
jgi:hypothetical protein